LVADLCYDPMILIIQPLSYEPAVTLA
jgi:hypothetical protein